MPAAAYITGQVTRTDASGSCLLYIDVSIWRPPKLDMIGSSEILWILASWFWDIPNTMVDMFHFFIIFFPSAISSSLHKFAVLMGFLSESQNFKVYFLPTSSKRWHRTDIGATISIDTIYIDVIYNRTAFHFSYFHTIRTVANSCFFFFFGAGHCQPPQNCKKLIRESSSPTHQLSYTLR